MVEVFSQPIHLLYFLQLSFTATSAPEILFFIFFTVTPISMEVKGTSLVGLKEIKHDI